MHNNDASFIKAAEEASGEKQAQLKAKGFYFGQDGSIHLNMPRVTAETMIHEGFHPVLDFILSKSPEKLDKFFNDLKSIKEAENIVKAAERDYAVNGDRTIKKEAITDFIAKVANGDIEINNTNFQKLKNYFIGLLNKLGFKLSEKKIVDLKGAQELKDLANLISGKFEKGEKITVEDVESYIKNADNLNSSEGIDNEFKLGDVKGDSNRGIQLQLSKIDDEILKSVKASIIDFKSIPNLQISRTLFYDNTRVGELEIKNRLSGYTPKVDGKGGFFYSYMPEALKNKAVLAFTSANQAIQTLKRQMMYPESAQAIASQNFQTAHLGNKSTLKALFGEKGYNELGIFQESVKNNPKGEKELLNALIESTISVANQKIQSGANAGKPTGAALEVKKMIDRNGGNLKNIKSLNDFRDKVLTFEGGDSFGARNVLFSEVLQEKPTKVTKSTREAHQIIHYKYGIPTISEIAEGNNQKQLNNAQTGDVIKLVKPYSEPIIYTTVPSIFEQYSKNPTKEMIDNGITIKLLPESLNHESYPFVLRGENVGILDNYIAAPQIYQEHEKIKNVPKKQSFYNVGRMPAEAMPGRIPSEPISEGTPQFSKEKEKEYDTENISGIPSEIGIGEKPIEAQPIEGRSTQETGRGRILQTPGAEGEGKGIGQKVGEVTTPQFSKAEKDDISNMKDILKEYVDEGYDLKDIKEIMQGEFGSDYDKEERIIEQAYNELTTTSIKNKTVIKERAERGLADVEMQAKRDFGTVLDNANKMVEKGEIVVPSLVNEIINNPRPLKAEESAALLGERMKLSKQYNTLMNEIIDAQEKGDKRLADIKQSQLDVIEQNMALNDEAARKAGYEQGLGLAARRMLIAQDYSLATQMIRLKAANGGKEVPKEYKERLTGLVKELEKATADLEKQEEKKIADDIIKKISQIKVVDKPKEQVKQERQTIKERILNTWNSFVKGVTGKGEEKISLSKVPQPIPFRQAQLEAITPDVKKLVKSYAEAGITDINDIIDGIHQDISSAIPSLTKDEVRDIIAEKYKVKAPQVPLTSKELSIQANVKKVKAQIDLLKSKLELAQRGKGQKAMDYLQGWHRFAILSGIPSIGKIGTAVAMRGLTSRTEGIIGKALSYIPGIRQIAKGAVREGDFNPKAEAKAFTTYFDEMTRKDIKQVLKTGVGELDYMYGDKAEFASKVPQWMEFFGRMHSAMKLLPKRAEFFRSLEMRSQRALEEGKDLNDPNVQMELGTAAYNDALRAVFMQDNYVTDAYKSLVNSLEKSNIQGAKESATVLKFLLPIVKVPTNYVSEETSYLFGGIKALYALRKGVSEMSPEQKDFFMRALKKQAIGAAFIMLGYTNPQAFGGYYTGKRKKEDLQAGDIELFGMHVPHWLSHSPLLEMLQVGATLRRASDAGVAKGEKPSKVAGVPAVMEGIIKQIPFASAAGKGIDAFKNGDTFGKYVTELGKGILIPQLVQNVSDFSDMKNGEVIKRLPTNWKEQLVEGTPFRKELEAKKELFSKEELDEPNLKLLQDKGVEIPFIRERLKIKVVQDEAHPDGVMTPDEYQKYSEELNNKVKKGIKDVLSSSFEIKEGSKDKYISGKKLEGKDLEDKIKKIEGEVSSQILEKMKLTPKEKRRTVTKVD